MKPRKIKEDDAPRTIACPHKVSVAHQHLINLFADDCDSFFAPFPSGMYKDVQGQFGDEKTFAHSRASCARLCGVWEGFRGEFKTKKASACTHRGKTFPGAFIYIYFSFLINVSSGIQEATSDRFFFFFSVHV